MSSLIALGFRAQALPLLAMTSVGLSSQLMPKLRRFIQQSSASVTSSSISSLRPLRYFCSGAPLGKNESEKNQNTKSDEPESPHLFIRGKLDQAEALDVELLKKVQASLREKLSELIKRSSSIPQSQRKKIDSEAHILYKKLNKTQMSIDFCSAITIDLFRKSDFYNPAP
jgi:hypothetical protein